MKSFYRHISVLAVAILFLLEFSSCGRSTNLVPELSQAENCMEERPDSALALLQAVDTLQLTTEEQKAKYALLLSMALDKNVIDRTDFDVLQPAIDYYADHGTATDQLRTYYYQGRIYFNAGNTAEALKSYIKALDRNENSNDILTKARLYFAQINCYKSVMKFEDAINSCKKAAFYFKKAGRCNSYNNCIATLINLYTLSNNESETQNYINQAKKLTPSMSTAILKIYYENSLIAASTFSKEKEIEKALIEYFHNVNKQEQNALNIALAYYEMHDYNEALNYIKKFDIQRSPQEAIRYYALLSQINKKLNKFKETYEAYINYATLKDSVNMALFREDTQFITERHQLEIQNLKQEEAKNRVFWIAIISICSLIAIILWICLQLKNRTLQKNIAEQEKFKYQQMYSRIEEEYTQLKNLLGYQNKLDDTIKATITQRLNLLNDFFKTHIKDDIHGKDNLSKKISEILEDQNAFIESTRLAFLSSHPQFIEHLEKQELTNWEIGYCCLYALGLNGKEVGTYMNLKNNYKINSDIRKKLKLDSHSTNLNCYILQIFEDYNKE